MKANWKLIFPIVALGLPGGIVGGILLSKMIAASREERAAYDRARAAGMLLTLSDLKRIAPADDDNVMVPLHKVWSTKKAFIKLMDKSPYSAWPARDVDDVLAAARDAVKRREAFDLPAVERLVFSDDWYTMFVIKQAMIGEAARNPAKARQCFDLAVALSRKLMASKDSQYAESGLREWSSLTTQALLAAYYAKEPVGDVLKIARNSDQIRPDLELARVECGRLLVLLDIFAAGSWQKGEATPISAEQEAALHDGAALRQAKVTLVSGFARLDDPKQMENLRQNRHFGAVLPKHAANPKVDLVLEAALDQADGFVSLISSGKRTRSVPEDLLPWFINACRAAGAPAGIEQAKDRYGNPIRFKSYAGGMMVYTTGQDGKEDDPKKWKDDRWIRVETPKAGTITLRTRVTLRN